MRKVQLQASDTFLMIPFFSTEYFLLYHSPQSRISFYSENRTNVNGPTEPPKRGKVKVGSSDVETLAVSPPSQGHGVMGVVCGSRTPSVTPAVCILGASVDRMGGLTERRGMFRVCLYSNNNNNYNNKVFMKLFNLILTR